MRRVIRFTIPPPRAGAALLDFLTARFTYHDRDGWRERIAAGRVTVGGRPADPGRRLAAGDELAYDASDVAEPPVDEAVAIVHADDDLLLADKPGNLPCHPGGRYFNHTLWALLKTRHGIADPILVNRLDRETSGLVLIARHAAAAKNLRAQFAGRTVAKRYLALVEGAFPERLDAGGWLDADYGGPVLKMRRFLPVPDAAGGAGAARPPAGAAPPSDEAAWAATSFRLLERRGPLSLVEAQPCTGRLHQIRATLRALGFPLVGDKMYGTDPAIYVRFCAGRTTDEDRARLRMPRQALHAAGLRFGHPRSGRSVAFDLPLPGDMQACLAAARA
jgi:23S rRNA pseudouridine955/2504/2580 synthase/23S rRNA pseudouridine1911/1915/1917 synthase